LCRIPAHNADNSALCIATEFLSILLAPPEDEKISGVTNRKKDYTGLATRMVINIFMWQAFYG